MKIFPAASGITFDLHLKKFFFYISAKNRKCAVRAARCIEMQKAMRISHF